MTTQNWVMISPALFLIAIAILLIPILNLQSKKFRKLADEMRRNRKKSKSDSKDRDAPE